MKSFLFFLSTILIFTACERHSAEETEPLHEEHGHHEKPHSSEADAKPPLHEAKPGEKLSDEAHH